MECYCPDSDPILCTLLTYPDYRGDGEEVINNDAECQCPCHNWFEDEDE
jgi:hypothetical protein